MSQVAKLFTHGRSQAVRLPAAFCFNCKEVYVRQDPDTGDLILSRKPESWDGFFKLLTDADVPADFMSDRQNGVPQERDLFNPLLQTDADQLRATQDL